MLGYDRPYLFAGDAWLRGEVARGANVLAVS
jgi:hypothetical protein